MEGKGEGEDKLMKAIRRIKIKDGKDTTKGERNNLKRNHEN